MFTLNCKGKLLVIEKPLIMGILNINDDSFYEGSRFQHTDAVAKKAQQMIEEGAAIIDVGGQSTRPGSIRISAGEELQRVIPVIETLSKISSAIFISIDTYYASVANAAVQAGASIVNDISGGEMDPYMIATVASLGVPYICMHMKGVPETMHLTSHYEDVVKEVLDFFIIKNEECRLAGMQDIIVDPGFGFGKSIEQNFTLLKNLELLKILGKPIMAGLSRKGTIYKTLQTSAENALNGTTVLNTIALQNGAAILRVHDVKEAKETAMLVEAYGKA